MLAIASVLVIAGQVSSCGSAVFERARPGQRPQTAGPAPGASATGAPTNLDPALGLLVGTPVYDGDFADPYVLVDHGSYYAYATNTRGANLPVIRSEGGGTGEYFGDAFPSLPAWSSPGFVWAPAVLSHGGRYILYYTTAVTASKRQCVSRAVAPTPLGPFVDDSAAPMVCQSDLGGTIDPSVVTDVNGASWLLFKNDGNCCNIKTSLWSQQLSSDGLSVLGTPHELLSADQAWEGDLIEAPSMVIDHGTYYLFYSANSWDTADYAVGYAKCTSITGPCTKPSDSPWMTSTVFAKGPGGQEYYAAAGQVWMVYHGWSRGEIGYPQGERRLFLDIVGIEGGRPVRVGGGGASNLVVVALAVLGLVAGSALVAAAVFTRHRRRRVALKRAVSGR